MNKQQFEALVGAHTQELFRYAMGRGADSHQAEDLVQEVFLRAWRHMDKLRDLRAAKAWLYTILKNEHARLYRHDRQESDELDEQRLADRTCYDTSTEAFALRCALVQLPEGYREPLLLQVIGGFSCSEIAELMKLTPNAVMARVSRARRQLREHLEQDEAHKTQWRLTP